VAAGHSRRPAPPASHLPRTHRGQGVGPKEDRWDRQPRARSPVVLWMEHHDYAVSAAGAGPQRYVGACMSSHAECLLQGFNMLCDLFFLVFSPSFPLFSNNSFLTAMLTHVHNARATYLPAITLIKSKASTTVPTGQHRATATTCHSCQALWLPTPSALPTLSLTPRKRKRTFIACGR
jgi:hypothetical protein